MIPTVVQSPSARRRTPRPSWAENARLAKAEKEWQLEREILRRAAAYFAREMK
ncbi:hypothetical protein [Streptomyces sp. NBC_01363]|uniref:hypothetical protein n=1 Tax=Streptomyces sp. NBC_01363 TaxID=2903840 RepID=UPI002258DE73|nr:hypothetical protein [Streptomyces sp. NBC_01363]MCX4734402.1 hypothetical protein [Streptomyces sp. NBC_01363]